MGEIFDFAVYIWVMMNFWSIALILVVYIVGKVLIKALVVPSGIMERSAWEQARANNRLQRSALRRFAITSLLFIFGIMASFTFVFIIYKIYG